MFQETECLDDLLELLGNPKVLKRSQWTNDETLEDGTTLKVDNADLKGEETFVQARNARFMAIFSERGIMSVKNTFIMNSFGLYDGAEKNKELASGSYESVCSEIEKFLERQKIENILEPAIYYFSPEYLRGHTEGFCLLGFILCVAGGGISFCIEQKGQCVCYITLRGNIGSY